MASFFRSKQPYDGLYEYLLETEKTLQLLDTPANEYKGDSKKKYIRNYVFQLLELFKYKKESEKIEIAKNVMKTICEDFGYDPSNLNECYNTVSDNIYTTDKGKFNKMLVNMHTKSPSKSPRKSLGKTLHNSRKGGRRTKRQIQNRRRKTQSKYT
jgi:hypothetical protein